MKQEQRTLCFVTWNTAAKLLGAVRTGVYIYMVPVITVAMSILVLHETLTWMSTLGMVLSLAGLFISEYKKKGCKDNGERREKMCDDN